MYSLTSPLFFIFVALLKHRQFKYKAKVKKTLPIHFTKLRIVVSFYKFLQSREKYVLNVISSPLF